MSDLGMSTASDVIKCKECGVLASQNNTINKTVDEQTFKTQKDAQPNHELSGIPKRKHHKDAQPQEEIHECYIDGWTITCT
jgi:hypothetical protein